MDIREKIADEVYEGLARELSYKSIADNILNLFSDSIKDIQWIGDCPDCEGKCYVKSCGSYRSGCIDCDGEGKVTRPATIEEVLENIHERYLTIELVSQQAEREGDDAYAISVRRCLTINNGTLRIKEKGK